MDETIGLAEFWLEFADDGSGKPGVIRCLFPAEMTAAQIEKAIDNCDFVERTYPEGGRQPDRQYFFS